MRTMVDNEELVATRRRLLADVATRLFREKGYHETLTRDIAQAMGTSVGALYQYIQNKEDLLVLIFQYTYDLYEEVVFPSMRTDGSAFDSLKNFISTYYRVLDEHHSKTAVTYHEFANLSKKNKDYFGDIEDRILQLVRDVIERGMAEGEFRPVNSLFIAHNVVSMAHMWALKRRRFRNQMTIDQYIDEQIGWLEVVLLKEGARHETRPRLASSAR